MSGNSLVSRFRSAVQTVKNALSGRAGMLVGTDKHGNSYFHVPKQGDDEGEGFF